MCFCFYLLFLFKTFFGKGIEKRKQKGIKKKEEKQSPSRGPEPFQGPATPRPSSADDRAPSLSLSMSLTPRAHLSARTVFLLHVVTEPTSSTKSAPIPICAGFVFPEPLKAFSFAPQFSLLHPRHRSEP